MPVASASPALIIHISVLEKRDNIIAAAIKDGNEGVFKTFFRSEFNNIVFFVSKYVKNVFIAQNIAQETFIALWNTREQINPELNIRTYVFTIARNKALNYLRDNAKGRTSTLEKREAALNLYALNTPSVSEQIEALELEELIEKIYRLLPENIKESFILSRQFGLTYEEIAQKRGITIKVVEYHIVSALRLFKKNLRSYLKLFLFF